MKKTLNDALKIFKAGDIETAWVTAQQDEGLLPGTTKEQWIRFALKALNTRKDESDMHDRQLKKHYGTK